jgi:O-antigen ligase
VSVSSGWRTQQSIARARGAAAPPSVANTLALVPQGVAAEAAPVQAARPKRPLVPLTAFPPAALVYAIAFVGIVAIRAHELVPILGIVRPALTLSILTLAVLVFRADPAARSAALNDISFKLCAAYFGWALLTAPLSLWPTAAGMFAVTTGLPAVVMLLAMLLSPPTIRSLERLTIGFVTFSAVHIIGLRFLGSDGSGRLVGEGAFDSNDLASLSALSFPLAISLVLRYKGMIRLIGLFGTAMSLAGMAWFNSRGGTLAMVAGMMALIVMQKGNRRWGLLGIVVAGGAVTWFTSSQDYRDRIVGINNLDNDYNYTSYDGRKQVWARGRGYIAKYPLSGVGASQFAVMEGMTLRENGMHGKWSAPHNAYLQAFAELGIPGGMIFVSIIGIGLVRGRRLAHPKGPPGTSLVPRPEYFASLVAFAAGAYFLSHAYFYALFALTGMISLATGINARQIAAATGGVRLQAPPNGARSRAARRR